MSVRVWHGIFSIIRTTGFTTVKPVLKLKKWFKIGIIILSREKPDFQLINQFINRKPIYQSNNQSINAAGLVISNWIHTVNFSARVTLEFDWWHRKTRGHFFNIMSSSVHHFKSISEFKLELQSGNAQFGSKLAIFVPCDLEIWWMTLKNNRAPLLSNIKLCASFHHHMWIQTGITVRKRLNGVMTSVTLTFDIWPWPFAWTSRLSMVITPENFRMIR